MSKILLRAKHLPHEVKRNRNIFRTKKLNIKQKYITVNITDKLLNLKKN